MPYILFQQKTLIFHQNNQNKCLRYRLNPMTTEPQNRFDDHDN